MSSRLQVGQMLLLSALAAPLNAEADISFTGLGFVPGYNALLGQDLSADGTTVVGYSQDNNGNQLPRAAFRWTKEGGLQHFGPLFEGQSFGNAVSADGSMFVGEGRPLGSQYSSFRWTAQGGAQGFAGGIYTTGLSDDGVTVVGTTLNSGAKAYRKIGDQKLETLGKFPGANETYGTDISGNGKAVIGYSWVGLIRAFRWTEQSGMQDLGILPDSDRSFAAAADSDGDVVVGYSGTEFWPRAFRWTESKGMKDLGFLPGGTNSTAYAVSGDGSVVGGSSYVKDGDGYTAFLWTESLGMVDLNEYLPTLGIDLDGWELSRVVGISADGMVLMGRGYYLDGKPQTWVAHIPEPSVLVLVPMFSAIARRRSR